MSKYEIHIGNAKNSPVAVGDNARAQSGPGYDHDDLTEVLQILHGIAVQHAGDPDAEEILAASNAVNVSAPERARLQRLAAAVRRLMTTLGKNAVQADALADAASKISELIHHL